MNPTAVTPPSPAAATLKYGIALAVIVIAVFCVYLAVLTKGVPSDDTDWAMYVMHAGNILHGHPYADTPYLIQPETVFEGPRSYPSGFALLLVPLYAAFGLNILVFKIIVDAALALSLLPIYFFSRRFLPPLSALLVIVVTAFGMNYVLTQNRLGSDAIYQLFSFTAIVSVLWIYDRGKDVTRSWLCGLLVALILAAAYLTRPIGIALLLAVAIGDIIRRRRITAFTVALLATFLAVVFLNNSLFHKDSSYNSEFIFSPALLARHAVAYFGFLSHVFGNPFSNLLRYVLWAPTVLLAGLGIWTSVRRNGLTLVEIYCVILLGVLCAYWLTNTRYLLPILPIYLVYVFLGAESVLERVPNKYRFGLRCAGAAALLIAPALNLARIGTFNQNTLISTPSFDGLCQQIAARTGAHDYVLFWNPRVLALYTGRPSSPYPLEDPSHVQRFVDRVQPNYIVFDKARDDDRNHLAPVISSQPQHYLTVYENEQFKLTEVVGAPKRLSNPPAEIP